MSRKEKIMILGSYCGYGDNCKKCVLNNAGWEHKSCCNSDTLNFSEATDEELDRAMSLVIKEWGSLFDITGSSPENGGNNMETPTITISLERYDELIKKEVLYDELTKNKGINMYLFQDVSEPLREGANNE